MSDENKKIKIDVDVEVKGHNSIEKLHESLEEVSESGSKLPGVFGEASEGILSFTKGIGSATKAAIAFIATPLGVILAGIAVAIAAVTAAFKGSEEGQNKFAKIMASIGAVVEKVEEVLAGLGDMIISAFEDPKKAIMDFVNLIKENLINRFTGLLELIPAIGEAINDVFHGEFAKAGKVAADAVLKVTTGVANATDKIVAAGNSVKEWGKEAAKTAKIAGEISERLSKAAIAERQLNKDRKKVEEQIADARLKAADKDTYTAAQRKKYLQDAQKLEEGIVKQQLDIAQIRSESIKEQLKYGIIKSNTENLNKEAEAESNLDDIRTKSHNTEKKLTKGLAAINKEIEADNKKAAEEEKKRIEKILEQKKKALETEVLKTKEGTQERIDAEKKASDKILEYETENKDKLGLSLIDLANEKAKLDEESSKKQIKLDDTTRKTILDNAIQTNLTIFNNSQKTLADEQALIESNADAEIAAANGNAEKIKSIKAKLAADLEVANQKEFLRNKKRADKNIAKVLTNAKVEIDTKYDLIQKAEDADIAYAQATITNEDELQDALEAIRSDADKKRREARKVEADEFKKQFDAKVAIAGEAESSIQSLSDLTFAIKSANEKKGSKEALESAKKQFKINKALQITSAVISGIKGVVNALSADSVLPEPYATAVKAATAIAVGIAAASNIAKISATQFSESATGGGSSATAASTATPRTASTPFTPNSLHAIGGGTSGFANPNAPVSGSNVYDPTKANKSYVVSQDLTKAQNSDAVLKRRASFS